MDELLPVASSVAGEETAGSAQQTPPPWAHLRPYQFQKGHAPLPGGGRPKGMRNAQTLLMACAPRLARRYIQRSKDSDAICIDARKWILPADADGLALTRPVLVLDLGDESSVTIHPPTVILDASDAD